MNNQWQERNRPLRLERRYEFANYDELRDFLDKAADLSEANGYYPDMGFGRDYVSITIKADEESNVIEDSQREFAEKLEELNNLTQKNRA
jgi:pterin-4a-carbinolamine dehydratase